jgi:single-stranded DNA-binding protein
MANVQVIQRNAHLAGPVRIEFITGREGKIAKGTVTAISNTVRGSGEAREQKATAIQWTLWGAQAENAAEFLQRGSHVNIVGRLQNNNYEKDGATVYGWAFTVEELDYLDSRAESEARRSAGRSSEGRTSDDRASESPASEGTPRKASSATRRPHREHVKSEA